MLIAGFHEYLLQDPKKPENKHLAFHPNNFHGSGTINVGKQLTLPSGMQSIRYWRRVSLPNKKPHDVDSQLALCRQSFWLRTPG
jgi:hypothetical protein